MLLFMKRMRSHPINILENSSRFLILLLLPIIRAAWTLLTSGGSFYAWLQGAWFDLVVLGAILALSIYNWYIYVFSFTDDGIYIRKGILYRQQRFIPFETVSVISIEAPWYYRPLHAVHLKADTDGGKTNAPDFFITVNRIQATELMRYSKIPFSESTQLKRFYIPRNLYLALFSLLTSNSLTGAIYVAASVSQIGNIFGQDIENRIVSGFTKFIKLVAFGLPPVAVTLAYAILACWMVSFLLNLVRHLRFSASRRGDSLEVHSGLMTHRKYSIAVARINTLLIRQSLMTKLFGVFSVFIYCTGYGKSKNEMSVLMPAGISKELRSNLHMLLPEISFAPRTIKPKLTNLSRFLIPPIGLILGGFAAGLLGMHFLPLFHSTFFYLILFFEIPAVWWLVVKLYSFFTNGIGVNEDVITLYYTSGYQVMTVSIPRKKLSKVEISQSLFQITTKCCDVTFRIYGEGRKRQKVLNLHLPEVRELLALMDEDLGVESIHTFTLWK